MRKTLEKKTIDCDMLMPLLLTNTLTRKCYSRLNMMTMKQNRKKKLHAKQIITGKMQVITGKMHAFRKLLPLPFIIIHDINNHCCIN